MDHIAEKDFEHYDYARSFSDVAMGLLVKTLVTMVSITQNNLDILLSCTLYYVSELLRYLLGRPSRPKRPALLRVWCMVHAQSTIVWVQEASLQPVAKRSSPLESDLSHELSSHCSAFRASRLVSSQFAQTMSVPTSPAC